MTKEKAIIDGPNAIYLQAPQVRRPNIKNIADAKALLNNILPNNEK